jgi:hypothetical protein
MRPPGPRSLLFALAARHAVPMVGGGREFVMAGGLVGYGAGKPIELTFQ